MRKRLAQTEGDRSTFTGTFVRFGIKPGWTFPVKTILLSDIKNLKGELITDHLWFNYTKAFEALDLKENDIIQFDARAKQYEKGYKGHRCDVYNPIRIDYKLNYPTKLKILKNGN